MKQAFVIKMPPKKPASDENQPLSAQRMTQHFKAGLTLPVARIFRHMKNDHIAVRISSKSAVSLASALEFLLAEVLDLSGKKAIELSDKETARAMIKPKHIMLAIRGDAGLQKTMGNVVIPMEDGQSWSIMKTKSARESPIHD